MQVLIRLPQTPARERLSSGGAAVLSKKRPELSILRQSRAWHVQQVDGETVKSHVDIYELLTGRNKRATREMVALCLGSGRIIDHHR
jgi:hypothetical protein